MMKTETTQTIKKAAAGSIPDRLYFRIGDVAELVGVKPYVLRYWETEFPIVSPQKTATGQRVYRRGDVESLLAIKHLLYVERYSIEGAKKRIRELRKDGSFKKFKKEMGEAIEQVASVPSLGANLEEFEAAAGVATGTGPGLTTEIYTQIRGGIAELQDWADAPIGELFHL